MTARLMNRSAARREQEHDHGALNWQIAQPRPQLRCPSCNSILYTRRHKRCSVCEAELPRELLFSPSEALRIKALLILEQEKHREWLARAGGSWR